jgi:photosystem II stability/assembly factor-like uncharacterized protein
MFGQWVNLGQKKNVTMVESNIGYRYVNEFVTPATGGIYKVFSTQNDWQTESLVNDEVGEPYGYSKIEGIDFINSSDGLRTIASGWQGSYFKFQKTADYGVTWEAFGQPISNFALTDLYMVNNTLGYVAGNAYDLSHGALYKLTQSSSIQIFEVDTLTFNSGGTNVEFTSASTGYIVVRDTNQITYVYKTVDSGNNWNGVFTDAEHTLSSVSFPDDLVGYISSADGLIFKTIDGGVNWEDVSPESSESIYSIDFINETVGYIGCGEGRILRTLDGGLTWDEQVSGVYSNIENIEMTNPTTVYCSSAGESLLKNSDALSVKQTTIDNSVCFVYPNPAEDVISISLQNNGEINNIEIYNQLGVRVLSTKKTEIDILNFESGFYYVIIFSGKHHFSTNFIKLR